MLSFLSDAAKALIFAPQTLFQAFINLTAKVTARQVLSDSARSIAVNQIAKHLDLSKCAQMIDQDALMKLLGAQSETEATTLASAIFNDQLGEQLSECVTREVSAAGELAADSLSKMQLKDLIGEFISFRLRETANEITPACVHDIVEKFFACEGINESCSIENVFSDFLSCLKSLPAELADKLPQHMKPVIESEAASMSYMTPIMFSAAVGGLVMLGYAAHENRAELSRWGKQASDYVSEKVSRFRRR